MVFTSHSILFISYSVIVLYDINKINQALKYVAVDIRIGNQINGGLDACPCIIWKG